VKKLKAVAEISRPINVLITFLTVIVAGFIALHEISYQPAIFYAAISAALINAAGNIINDIFDLDVDKVNRPERVLPSNRMKKSEAYFFFAIFNLTALIFAYFVNIACLVISIFAIIIVFFYSLYFKKVILLGNFIVGFLTGMAFVYGGLAVDSLETSIIPAFYAMVINFVREIIKDVEDMEGDKEAGIDTYPLIFGADASFFVSKIVILAFAFITLLPYVLKIYSFYYLLIVLAIDTSLIYFSFGLKKESSKREINNFSKLLKVNMVLGLLAVWFGSYR
jgi:geranylgeranylglycerol-phosphate geranylgeranyltransferase